MLKPPVNNRAQVYAQVELDVPLPGPFDYVVPEPIAIEVGTRVVVPWGRTRRIGLVRALANSSTVAPSKLRPIERVLDAEPLVDSQWWALIDFAAAYYQRAAGEIALPALPKLLRAVPAARMRASAIDRLRERAPAATTAAPPPVMPPLLNSQQQQVLQQLTEQAGFAVHLLYGITGSGKTEVYWRWFDALLRRADAQVLLLVPEIGLTPQLIEQLLGRFAGVSIAVLHSALGDAERAKHWLAAAQGRAKIVVGTRLAVLTPLPRLAAIVVDEEHDASFKQQEGAHYSARDLAIMLGRQRDIAVLLGSATPSLESWFAQQRGRYRLHRLTERATGAALPQIRVLDIRRSKLVSGLSEPAIEAITGALRRGEQSLVFLNRRGYAPVLSCEVCGWLSRCDHCAAFRVLHRLAARGAQRYALVCHHCAATAKVPAACPSCGNQALNPVGRGTQRLEEGLAELFPSARIVRLDRDVARRAGALERAIASVHAGDVDVILGTQLLAKGHHFTRLSQVIVADADGALYCGDFRAPERLFATLMQVAGRAGRERVAGLVMVQTRFAAHPMFSALRAHDFEQFAKAQLGERRSAGLPPFVHQALLRIESDKLANALAFGALARDAATVLPAVADGKVRVYDPVPMPLERLAGVERAQLLLDSASRRALQQALGDWLEQLRAIKSDGARARWQLEVDPLEI